MLADAADQKGGIDIAFPFDGVVKSSLGLLDQNGIRPQSGRW